MISSAIWNTFFKDDQNWTSPWGDCNLQFERIYVGVCIYSKLHEKNDVITC